MKKSRKLKNYKYNCNQLSRDKPFRIISNPYNKYIIKEKDIKQNQDEKEKGEINKPYERTFRVLGIKKRTNSTDSLINNSYNIINNISYPKNNNKYYAQNKDHVRDIFQYPIKEQSNDFYFQKYNNNLNEHKKINRKKDNYIINTEVISDINQNEYFFDNVNLFKDCAYKENQNPIYRNTMEDKGRLILNINNDKDKSLFCLFDGHGGEQVSTFLINLRK